IGIDLRSEIAGSVSSDIQIHFPSQLPELKAGDKPVAVGTRLAAELNDPRKIRIVMPGNRDFELTVLGGVSANGPAGSLVDNALFLDLAQAATLLEPDRADYVT